MGRLLAKDCKWEFQQKIDIKTQIYRAIFAFVYVYVVVVAAAAAAAVGKPKRKLKGIFVSQGFYKT